MSNTVLSGQVTPDWEAFLDCIVGKGTPRRVHHIELFLDREVQEAVCQEFGLLVGLDPDDPYWPLKRQVRLQRFLGYDYVLCGVDAIVMPFSHLETADTADLAREGGRNYIDEHKGPITNWAEFEAYPWPDPATFTTRALEWYERNLPDDMCVIGGLTSHYLEWLTWAMGYETLCFALFDNRDLVQAIVDRISEITRVVVPKLLEFERVKFIWGSDDMGYRSGTLISPDDMRAFVLPGHREAAAMTHEAGRLYLLHSCGNLAAIMPDLLDDVRIDAKHSYEDTIESVIEVKHTYGQKIALLGGIDVDFLCRSDEQAVRARVRKTLAACLPGGRYCLGTGNSVANYIPVANYLAMLDEGRRYRI
jgi:uroporphyrinogen decarboxylase